MNNENSHAVFTSVNLDYLSRALVLCESIKKHNSYVKFYIALIEDKFTLTNSDISDLSALMYQKSVDGLIFLEDLPIQVRKTVQGKKVTEICTMVKPFVAQKLIDSEEYSFVTYIDPDVLVYDDLNLILKEYDKDTNTLLTPHLTDPPLREWSVYNNEIFGSMRHGVFNLGFISLKNTHESRKILAWWGERLLKYCREDYESGLWTDQKWFDLAITYFSGIKIIRSPGWNLATWNYDERVIDYKPKKLVNNVSLLFYHFSKYPSNGFSSSKSAVSFNNTLDTNIYEYSMALKINTSMARDCITELKQKRNLEIYSNNEGLIVKIRTKIFKLKRFIKLIKKIDMLRKFLLKLDKALTAKIKSSSKISKLDYTFLYELDEIYLMHYGGGGVDEFLQNELLKLKNTKWAILKPNRIGNAFEIWTNLYHSEIFISKFSDITLIIEKANKVTVHHILGLEYFVPIITSHHNVHIFLHDRYLIDQRPFSDTLSYATLTSVIAGVNRNLNLAPYEEISNSIWIERNKAMLVSAKSIKSPSRYILNEFTNVDNTLNIEIIDWDNSSLIKSYLNNSNKRNISKITEIAIIGIPNIHKGAEKVLEVCNIAQRYESGLRFRIFGDLPVSFQNLFEDLENVEIIGQIPRSRILSFLESRDNLIGWQPSLTGESFSFAISDFLATGTPIFASAVGAIPERIQSRSDSLLYSPKLDSSEIYNLLSNFISEKSKF